MQDILAYILYFDALCVGILLLAFARALYRDF